MQLPDHDSGKEEDEEVHDEIDCCASNPLGEDVQAPVLNIVESTPQEIKVAAAAEDPDQSKDPHPEENNGDESPAHYVEKGTSEDSSVEEQG